MIRRRHRQMTSFFLFIAVSIKCSHIIEQEQYSLTLLFNEFFLTRQTTFLLFLQRVGNCSVFCL